MANLIEFTRSIAPQRTLSGIQFGVFDPDTIRGFSVTQQVTSNGREVLPGIYKLETFDQTGRAVLGGLSDPRMGTINDSDSPGYFGHIELARPVYHVSYIKTVRSVLQCVSFHTSKIMIARDEYKFVKAMEIKSPKKWVL